MDIVKNHGNVNLFKSMLCLEINFNGQSLFQSGTFSDDKVDPAFNDGYQPNSNNAGIEEILKDKLAMCSINQKMLGSLKKRMMNSVITNIFHKRNRYDISIITNTE